MKRIILVAFSALVVLVGARAQSDVETFKVEVQNAFVWGSDTPTGAKSWSIKDPLTGADTLKMSHDGVEVSSRMGFEKLHPNEAGELLVFATTVVNNTQTNVQVAAGEITVDGHLASLLPDESSCKGQKSACSDGTNIVHSGKLYCFTSGFLSAENILSRIDPAATVVVEPRRSLTVSGVTRDPRHYSMLCSSEGCFPKGSIRYAIRVGGHEYIFIWPGRSVVNCGK